MAIYYTLAMDSPLKAADALRVVAAALGAQHAEGESANTANVHVSADDNPPQLRPHVIEESFGFRAALSLDFHLRKLDGAYPDAVERDRDLVKAAMALLATGPGDAVLLQNGEHVVLQRLRGKLELNSARLQAGYAPTLLLSLPYTSRRIESPLLKRVEAPADSAP